MKVVTPSKVQPHQVARSLAALFRVPPESDLPTLLQNLQQTPRSLAPFDLTQVELVPEQLAVIPQMTADNPTKTQLFEHLVERPDTIHLVVDAYKTGRNALFYCMLTSDTNLPLKWLQRMERPALLLNQAEGDLLIATPARVFVA